MVIEWLMMLFFSAALLSQTLQNAWSWVWHASTLRHKDDGYIGSIFMSSPTNNT